MNEEKKAKEMFEELGYEYGENDIILGYTKLENDKKQAILFHKVEKGICCNMEKTNFAFCTMNEFKAIQQQIKELGW